MFLRDDNIFYNSEDFKSINSIMESEQNALCFSLRLGKNTKLCRNMNTANSLVDIVDREDGKTMKWNWSKLYLDFGFPFSTEAHIFRTRELLKMLKQVSFENPDQIEENLFEVFEAFPRNEMCSFNHSVVVKDVAGPDQKQINEMYQNDKQIELSEMDFSNVDGCWAYIPKPTREVKTIEKTETNA